MADGDVGMALQPVADQARLVHSLEGSERTQSKPSGDNCAPLQSDVWLCESETKLSRAASTCLQAS